MKKTAVILFLLALMFSACSKKETAKLETFSPEAFAYQIGDSSEVDASTRVKGFEQKLEDGMYSATLSYDVDIVTPKGDTVKSIISKVVDRSQKEKMTDTALEAQIELDSTYVKGKYKIIFRVKDVLSNQNSVSTADFSVGE